MCHPCSLALHSHDYAFNLSMPVPTPPPPRTHTAPSGPTTPPDGRPATCPLSTCLPPPPPPACMSPPPRPPSPHPTPTKMARDVVEGVERLDGALKRREPPDAISPMIQQLSERVKDVALALDRMDEIR